MVRVTAPYLEKMLVNYHTFHRFDNLREIGVRRHLH